MTAASPEPAAGRLRIAITSPDILARIRQVFADNNLDIEIVRMPYVEVDVRPAPGRAVADRSPVKTALHPPAGAAASNRLRAEYRLSVLGAEDRPRIRRPAPKGPDRAAAGVLGVRLSRRQCEVMALVSHGVRNAEIAERLHLSEKTVKNHITRIFRELGARSRVEAVLIWQRYQKLNRQREYGGTP